MITGLILTYNEELNISRTLENLTWLTNIIIIDSYSSDNTIELINSYANTIIYQRKFDNFAHQCNFGIEKCSTEWILSIDADYIISDKLKIEINELILNNSLNKFVAYEAKFKYCVYGKPLRSTILPPRKVLFNKHYCSYVQDGHAHKLQSDGRVKSLNNYIFHDDRKSIERWLVSQNNYSNIELIKLLSNNAILNTKDKIRNLKYFAPFLIFFYCYFFKLGILNGKKGFYYAYQRMYAELILSIKIIDNEIKGR